MADVPQWRLSGDWFDVCKCNIPCPCYFAQAPTFEDCEATLVWRPRGADAHRRPDECAAADGVVAGARRLAALAGPMISAGVMTAGEAARLAARPGEPDFLGCGFAFIGVWGRNGPPA